MAINEIVMSFKMLARVFNTEVDNVGEFAVLAVLANHQNDITGQCNPSVARIAQTTKLNRKTVMKSIKSLESKGLLTASRRNGGRTDYKLNLTEPVPQEGQAIQEHAVPQTAPIPQTAPVPCIHTPVPQAVQPPVPPTAPEPISKPINNHLKDVGASPGRRAPSPSPQKLSLDDVPEHLRDAMKEFILHRKNLKKPLTQQAVGRFVKQVMRIAEEVNMSEVDVITLVIDKGWQSIEAEWIENARQKRNGQSDYHNRKEREAERWRNEVLYGSF